MVKLTEEMIVARTRVSDMNNVKKLNCWGSELSDISVVRRLINVEVLSLSVNCITSLSDIQCCKNLQELYIRKNKIHELNEIMWLKDLPKLKSLWLEENPCVGHGKSGEELYRMTVIRNLPLLQKLDNNSITPEETTDSMRKGIELAHPNAIDNFPSFNESPYSSPSRKVSNQVFEAQEFHRPPSGLISRALPQVEIQDNQSIVGHHYEQTYHQVNQQIDSARQLISQRQISPDRPYTGRPKNRNSNILSAVLCLIKELDSPSLEVVEMAVRCRIEELED